MAISSITANGASSTEAWAGGKGTLTLGGEFDGASARVEFSTNSGTTWFPIEDEALDAMALQKPKAFNFELPSCDLRVFVVGAGASTDLTLTATAI